MAAVTPVAGGADADATVIRESWADPDRFAALYDRYASSRPDRTRTAAGSPAGSSNRG